MGLAIVIFTFLDEVTAQRGTWATLCTSGLLVSRPRAAGPEAVAFSLPATAPPDQSNELDEEIELVKNKHFYGIHARAGSPMAVQVWVGGSSCSSHRVCTSPPVSWDTVS